MKKLKHVPMPRTSKVPVINNMTKIRGEKWKLISEVIKHPNIQEDHIVKRLKAANIPDSHEISNMGRVRNNRFVKTRKCVEVLELMGYASHKRYKRITINNVTILIHRLVALSFQPKEFSPLFHVHHKDEANPDNKLDNRNSNLEWIEPIKHMKQSNANIWLLYDSDNKKLIVHDLKEFVRMKCSDGLPFHYSSMSSTLRNGFAYFGYSLTKQKKCHEEIERQINSARIRLNRRIKRCKPDRKKLPILKNEKWKVVKDYPHFFVSNMGRLYSFLSDQLIGADNTNRYVRIRVTSIASGLGRHLILHRLVAETFIPNPLNLDTVNHIDGDSNAADNLEWMTRSDNSKDGNVTYDIDPIVDGLGRIIEVSDGMTRDELAKKAKVGYFTLFEILHNINLESHNGVRLATPQTIGVKSKKAFCIMNMKTGEVILSANGSEVARKIGVDKGNLHNAIKKNHANRRVGDWFSISIDEAEDIIDEYIKGKRRLPTRTEFLKVVPCEIEGKPYTSPMKAAIAEKVSIGTIRNWIKKYPESCRAITWDEYYNHPDIGWSKQPKITVTYDF